MQTPKALERHLADIEASEGYLDGGS